MRYRFAFTLFVVMMASTTQGGNIFDDDWAPATRPAAPAPALTTFPTPPAKAVPQSVNVPSAPPRPTPPRRAAASTPASVVRRPVPPKQALDHSRDLLKEAFAKQLADRAPAARQRLAKLLLAEAAKAAENPSDQFALYGGALNAAKESASLRLVIAVADEMSRQYAVDAPRVKASAALNMPLKADSPTNTVENVLAGLELVDALVAGDDVPNAARLCGQLRAAAATAGDAALTAVLQRRQQEIDQLHLARDRVAAQVEKVKSSPDDPAANAAVGGYQCFYAGNWPVGLPMLAKGADADLKKLAATDLAEPADADALLALADGWWAAAAKQPPAAQTRIHQHAAALYARYTSAAGAGASPLQRMKIDKRTAEAAGTAGSAAAGGAMRDVIVRQKLARLKEFAERLLPPAKPGAARPPFPAGDPLSGDVTWSAGNGDLSLTAEQYIGYNGGNHGHKLKDCSAKVLVEPGYHFEGGTLMVSNGSIDLRGEADNPIVLRNVHIGCELTGVVKASFVVFDHCTFTKDGGFGWIGAPSAKFYFSDCLLLQSNFKRFDWDNYGIKLQRCTFAGCAFPDRNGKPKEKEDSYKTARHDLSLIADCDFYGCELAASVCWMPQRCNLVGCKITDAAAYASPIDLPVELGLIAEERDSFLSGLRNKTASAGAGHVVYTATTEPFASQAFPRP